ncbi:MAG: MaoC family dehydratase [Myxococcota bacterium]|nr:MaoC family dehydratase [Myxococcota bacterium]
MTKDIRYDELCIGDRARFSKTITEHDVYSYAGITGDFNTVHINQEMAQKSPFKTRIAHGMLSAGLISTVLGTKLPGPGTIYLKQDLKFLKPVHFGDTLTAECEIVKKIDEKKRLELSTVVHNQQGEEVLSGIALVMKED